MRGLRGKLILAVKSGRVVESQWVPRPLPDGIVNGDDIYDAVLRRAGVLRVQGWMKCLMHSKP